MDHIILMQKLKCIEAIFYNLQNLFLVQITDLLSDKFSHITLKMFHYKEHSWFTYGLTTGPN